MAVQIVIMSRINIESANLTLSPKEVMTWMLYRPSNSKHRLCLCTCAKFKTQHHGSVSSMHVHAVTSTKKKLVRFIFVVVVVVFRTVKLELWRGPAAGWLCLCGSLAWQRRAQFDHAAGLHKQTTVWLG